MKPRRVLALCLVLVLSLGCFAACAKEPTADELIAKADQVLLDNPYTIAYTVTFENDEAVDESATMSAQVTGIDMSMAVNGEDAKLTYGIEMAYGEMTVEIRMNVIVVDDTVYIETVQSDGEEEYVEKMKSAITDAQRDEFLGQIGAETTEITAAHFETVTMEKVDGVYVITCTGIKEEVADKLNGVFAVIGATNSITASNVTMVCEVKDNKYQKATVTCDYNLGEGDDAMTLGATFDLTFDYAAVTIAAPADAADYEDFDIGDMLE